MTIVQSTLLGHRHGKAYVKGDESLDGVAIMPVMAVAATIAGLGWIYCIRVSHLPPRTFTSAPLHIRSQPVAFHFLLTYFCNLSTFVVSNFCADDRARHCGAIPLGNGYHGHGCCIFQLCAGEEGVCDDPLVHSSSYSLREAQILCGVWSWVGTTLSIVYR